MVETTRQLPPTLKKAYEPLALIPTKDTHVSNEVYAAEEAKCSSDGKACHPSTESFEHKLGLKDDYLASMFEIYYVVNVSCTVQYVLEMQTKSGAELRPCLYTNQKSLDPGRSRLHFDYIRCLACHACMTGGY